MRARTVLVQLMLFVVVASLILAAAAALADEGPDAGRRIYREGVLASGQALTGIRAGGTEVAGAAAACVTCHRKSGMGSVEGDIQIRPITGNYLMNVGHKNMATMDPRIGKQMNQSHAAYTDESLARAIREGVNSDGQAMNPLMPRFDIGDADMKALIGYLKQLSRDWSPGVSEHEIRFATVIAPGVEPERRQAAIGMLQAIVAQKNASTLPGRRHMVSPAEMLSRTERKWALDVWELHGEPSGWAAQLEERYRRQPVFALVSGVSDTTWQPVSDFCERNAVPCWFPSVDLPAPQPRYPVYFQGGVALEAGVLAAHLRADRAGAPRRVVQLFRDEPVARGGAEALARALEGSGIAIEGRLVKSGDAAALSRALRGLEPGDALMLWLRPGDLALLAGVAPPAVPLYLSTRMIHDEHAPLPAAWKATARLVYPYELPERRDANLASFHVWMQLHNMPVVDEPLQSEVFFAMSYLTGTVAEMLDNLYRDYLIERTEDLLSLQESAKSVDETRGRATLGRPGELQGRYQPYLAREAGQQRIALQLASVRNTQTGTSIYPRLGLAPGQRFASKGGYIVRYAGPDGDRLVAESDWIVP